MVTDFSGADGAQWFSGADVPANSLGENGDWYFRTSNATIWLKASGVWSEQVDIDGVDGATWHSDAVEPAGTLGVVGDWYFRTSNGYVYEKTGASTWTFRYDLTGPQGPRGARGATGEFSDAAVTTEMIALSATADLHHGQHSGTSYSESTAPHTETLITTGVAVPGGAGYEYLVTGFVTFHLNDARARYTLYRGSTAIYSSPLRDVGGSGSTFSLQGSDQGNHTSDATFSLEVWVGDSAGSSTLTVVGAIMEVIIAKR